VDFLSLKESLNTACVKYLHNMSDQIKKRTLSIKIERFFVLSYDISVLSKWGLLLHKRSVQSLSIGT
jgi:hypothetical protein